MIYKEPGAKVKKLLCLLFVCSLVLFICKDESNLVSPKTQSKGSVTIKLDKSTTLSNVTQVSVLISRDGFSSISGVGVMYLLSDSTAELTLRQISAGT